MDKLYYTVKKQTEVIGDIEECTGWKTIRVYELNDEEIVLITEIEAKNDSSSWDEIQMYLDNAGIETVYEFEQL